VTSHFTRRCVAMGVACVVVGTEFQYQSSEAPNLNPVAIENARGGTSVWLRRRTPRGEIEGYVASESVGPGDQLRVSVSTRPGIRYRVEIFRLGWYDGDGARLVACSPTCAADEIGRQQQAPVTDAATNEIIAGWPTTDALQVTSDWTTGYYIAELVVTSAQDYGAAYRIPFIVRAPATNRSTLLVVAPANTWEAYNNWGGASTYVSPSGRVATKVSFDRPGVTDQSGLQYEVPLVRFLEREGYDVSYAVDSDIDQTPEDLLDHRLVVVAGHAEYWTSNIRDALDAAIAQGTNIAFLGANFGYWQIRYEDANRTIVAYKERANLDPTTDHAQATTRFRDLVSPRPECKLAGVEYEIGSWGIDPQPLSVVRTAVEDPWFRGTGFTSDTTLPGLVGGSVDGVEGEWDAIAPGCVAHAATPLFHFSGAPLNKADADAVRYVAPSGARIFASGTHRFSWGLDDDVYTDRGIASEGLQQFMRNVVADLSRPIPPARLQVFASAKAWRFRVDRYADPRVNYVAVYGHPGPDLFDSSDGSLLCETSGRICVAKPLGQGLYRFIAVTVDDWAQSAPTPSRPVTARMRKGGR
jgi:hypothetical protein